MDLKKLAAALIPDGDLLPIEECENIYPRSEERRVGKECM